MIVIHNYFVLLQREKAQVAELVDAPVSKTGEVILVPVRSRPRVRCKALIINIEDC